MTDLPGDQTIHATTEHAIGEDSGVITHPKFRMWLRPDGIVQVVWSLERRRSSTTPSRRSRRWPGSPTAGESPSR